MITSRAPFEKLIVEGTAKLGRDPKKFAEFFSWLDSFEFWFDIVTPQTCAICDLDLDFGFRASNDYDPPDRRGDKGRRSTHASCPSRRLRRARSG